MFKTENHRQHQREHADGLKQIETVGEFYERAKLRHAGKAFGASE
jgi:hypothetical protein